MDRNTTDETGIWVHWSDDGVAFSTIENIVTANAETYTDTGLSAETT